MITLDQVQKLETKVNDAVDLINRLKAEKVVLEEKIVQYEMQILELEEMAETLNKDQNEIEDKIIGALNQLEDIGTSVAEATETVVEESVVESQHFEETATSAEGSVSEDQEFVITESVESDEEVTNSENNSEEDSLKEDISETERDDDNQSELQEIITEDSQDGIPTDETVKADSVPTVESGLGEMPESTTEKKEENGPAADLFEQSLDIF